MSLFEKIKLLETKKDNPDQLSLDLDGATDKRSKAQKFTDKINKGNKNRPEGKRPYFRGRKAERVNASGVKPTGSIAKGQYKPQSFGDVVPRSTYKSSPTGQRAYDFQKMKIDTRDEKRASDKLDRKLDKSLMKDGKYPKELQKAMKKDGITKPSQAVRRAARETQDKLRASDPIKAKKQAFDTMGREFKKMSKPQQNKELAKVIKTQTAKGRKFNPNTGNFEDPLGFEKKTIRPTGDKKVLKGMGGKKIFPGDRSGAYKAAKSDLETKELLKKAGASGDVSDKAGRKIKKRVETIRKTRADKLGTPDPFSKDAKPLKSTKFKDIFKGIKKGGISPSLKGSKKAAFNIDLSKDPFKTSSDTPLSPNYPQRRVSKSIKTSSKSSKKPVYNAKSQAIKDIRAMNQRLGKPLSKVQKRKEALRQSKEYTAKQLRNIRMQREYDGGLSGTIGPPTGTPKVKFSSGAKGEFASGSADLGNTDAKFANRKRTPAPQLYRNKGVGIEKTGETKVDKSQRKAISKTSKQIKDIKAKLLKQRQKVRSFPGDELGRKNTELLRKINRGIKGIESQEVSYQKAAKGFGNPNAPTVYNKKFADLQKDLTKKGKIAQIKPEKTDKVIDLFGKSKSGNYRSGSQSIYPNRLTNQGSKVSGTDLFRQNTIKGAGASKVTGSKTGSEIFKQNIIKGVKGPTSMKNVKLGSKAFMKKIAKTAIKSGPVGRGIAGAALVAGGLYAADNLRKRFAGGGKAKGVPAVKGSPLRYKQGVKDDQKRDIGGQKKYFKLSDIRKTPYFTPSDLKNATFDNKADKNLQKRVRDSLKK